MLQLRLGRGWREGRREERREGGREERREGEQSLLELPLTAAK